MGTVRELTYLSDRVSAGGGCVTVGGLCSESVLSGCMAGDFLQSRKEVSTKAV